jgi:hypothetical protein
MKLSDVKEQIDIFFNKVDPDDLYEMALSCGFKEVDNDDDYDYSLEIHNFEPKNKALNELIANHLDT